jgi:ABC-type sugar transport system permease subunit
MLLAGPNLILLSLFTFRPIVYSVWISLTSWELPGRAREFIGVENYARLLNDSEFWRVLLNTALYAMGVVIIAQTLAFFLAIALNRRRGMAVLRTLAFTPHVTLTVAAAIAWLLVLDPRQGPAAGLYAALGVEGPRWLADSRLALPALMVVGAWKEIGFATLFFLASLQNMPDAPYEAARVEGIRPGQALRHLTLPMMTPAIFFLGVSGLIAASKMFDAAAVMTRGGPVYPDSSVFVYHLYTLGFRRYEIGYASAFATAMWSLLLAGTAVQLRLSRRWVSYDL